MSTLMFALMLAPGYLLPDTIKASGFLFDKDRCNITDRFSSCPDGQCCVLRDQFLMEVNECKPFLLEGEKCVTRLSYLECPCQDGLDCEAAHVGSIFGKCQGRYTTTAQPSCNITARYMSCPAGYCCVRDDFLFTETKCKLLGREGVSCSTRRRSEFECPCDHGFKCLSNLHGSHVSSLFGKCHGPDTTSQTTGGSTDVVTMTTDLNSASQGVVDTTMIANEVTTDQETTSPYSQSTQEQQSSTSQPDEGFNLVG